MLYQLPLSEFALRLVARPGVGDWMILIAREGEVFEVASRLRTEAQILGDCPVAHISNLSNAPELAEHLRNAQQDNIVVVSGIDGFSEEEWRHLDLLRSRLVRERAVVLVMSEPSLNNFARNAPNVASWVGGSIWTADVLSELLSEDERATRLESLRHSTGLAHEEVIRRAEAGTLPNEPQFSEWLVLLGRVDLIGH